MATKSKTEVETINSTESILAIKNSVRIALSTICYLRTLFPEDIFTPRTYCGVELMLFKPDVKKSGALNKSAHNLVQSFEKGVFDALEKKYLERLLINIHAKDPTKDSSATVLESYSFKFGYNDNDSLSINGTKIGKTKDEIQKSTRALLKKMMMLTGALTELPNKTYVSLNLIYNKMTPANYEPPLFAPIKKSELPCFEKTPLSIDLGQTDTGLDRVVIKLRRPDDQDPETQPDFPVNNEKLEDPEATLSENMDFDNNSVGTITTEPVHEPDVRFARQNGNLHQGGSFKEEKVSKQLNEMTLNGRIPFAVKSSWEGDNKAIKWTADSMQANIENSNPKDTASRSKRKVDCGLDTFKTTKRKKN